MSGDFDSIIADLQALRRRGLGGERAAYVRASAMAEAALDHSEGANRARLLREKAQLARDMGQKAEACAAYAEAAGIWRRSGDRDGLAHALRHLADIHVEDGDAAAARPLIEEAIILLADADALTRANGLRVLALCYEGVGLPARETWLEAQALYRQEGVAAGVADCQRHLGKSAG